MNEAKVQGVQSSKEGKEKRFEHIGLKVGTVFTAKEKVLPA